MTATLLTIYGGRDKPKATALVGTQVQPKKPRPPRLERPAGISAVAPADSGPLCWYCKKGGHIKAECRPREKHLLD